MNYSLQGKAAIVTGAAGGIGSAIARAFMQAGAKVACVDLEASKAPAGSLAIKCDVSSEADTRAAVEQAVKAYGGLHLLVNAAAMRDPSATVTDLDLAGWNRVFAVNVGGAFLMSRWTIPHMVKAGGGSIIHIASQLGTVGTARRVDQGRAHHHGQGDGGRPRRAEDPRQHALARGRGDRAHAAAFRHDGEGAGGHGTQTPIGTIRDA